LAHVDDSDSGRSANIELNLVPFIDLMSVLITFLLITAVWTQVSMIQLGASMNAKKNNEDVPVPPPDMPDISLRLDIKEEGYRLIVGKEVFRLPRKDTDENKNKLLERLKQVKVTYPTKVDAVVTVAESLAYENLITGMDLLLLSGFPNVSISTAEAE
jgi:biopolymer transport protein TolR